MWRIVQALLWTITCTGIFLGVVMLRLSYGPISLNFLKPYLLFYLKEYEPLHVAHILLAWPDTHQLDFIFQDIKGKNVAARQVTLSFRGLDFLHITCQNLIYTFVSTGKKAPLWWLDKSIELQDATFIFPVRKQRLFYRHVWALYQKNCGVLWQQNEKMASYQNLTHSPSLYVANTSLCVPVSTKPSLAEVARFSYEPKNKHFHLVIQSFWFPFMLLNSEWNTFLKLEGIFKGIIQDNRWEIEGFFRQKAPMCLKDHTKTLPITHLYVPIKVTQQMATFGPAHMRLGQAWIDLTGQTSFSEENIQLIMRLKKGDIDLRNISLLWPTQQVDAARRWIVSHFHSGRLNSFDLRFSRKKTITNVKGKIGITNTTLSFMDDMPPITRLSALAQIKSNAFSIQILSGLIKQQQIKKGLVLIKDLDKDISQLALKVDFQGPLRPFLEIMLPFSSLKKLPVTTISGKEVTILQAQFPLVKDLKKKDVKLFLDTKATNVAFQVALNKKNLKISDGKIYIKGSPESITVGGRSVMNKVPVQWRWEKDRLSFSGKPTLYWIINFYHTFFGTPQSVSMSTANAHIQNLFSNLAKAKAVFPAQCTAFPPAAPPLDYAILLKTLWPHMSSLISLCGTYQEGENVTLFFDLTPHTIDLPWIQWTKKTHEPLNLRFFLKKQDYKIQLQGIANGKASWSFSRGQLTHVKAQLHLKDTWAQYLYHQDTHRLFFRGNTLVLRDLSGTWPPDGSVHKRPQKIFFDLFCRDIVLKDIILSQCQIKAQGHTLNTPWHQFFNIYWKQGKAFSIIRQPLSKKKGYLHALFTPRSSHSASIEIDATNAGIILHNLGITKKVKAEGLHLWGQQDQNGTYTGQLHIDSLQTQALALGKLISMISPTSFLEIFSPGVNFDTVSTQFRYQKNQLHISHGIAKGINLGIAFQGKINCQTYDAHIDGVIIPGYLFNTFFQYVPILGWLFGGSKGIVSSEFSITGSLNNPRVRMKSLSIFKLGIFKEVFQNTVNFTEAY